MALESKLRAAIYARVSTTNGQDPTVQINDLREHCGHRHWDVVREYIDVGISGSKEKRPELDRLMSDAHRRKFDIVLVWKFDRFARSVSHLLRALENFRALGVEFVSYSEQLDTSTPTGKLVFTVLGAVAELERSLIIERVRAGMRNAAAKGKRIGRPALKNLDRQSRIQIAECYSRGEDSLRALARKHGTSLAMIQRCVKSFRQDWK